MKTKLFREIDTMDAKTSNLNLWTPKYPELGTGPIPTEPCISPEYYERERDLIYKKVWLHVGRVEEIPNVGDYFIKEIKIAKASVIIIRDKEGSVRAFHNVCRHRSNKVLWDEEGSCRAMTCKFHGWAYKLDGTLADVPDEDRFFDFKKEDHGLIPVCVDVWAGFIFINLDPKPRETLLEYLGEIVDDLKGYPFEQMTACYAYKADLNCNWKVELDAQLEGYHAPYLHRLSAAQAFRDEDVAAFHALNYNLYSKHRTMASPYTPHELNPTEALAAKYGGSMWVTDDEGRPECMNPTKAKNWGFDAFSIFPNFQILLTDALYLSYNYWPTAVDRCDYEGRFFFPPAKTAGERFAHEFNLCGTLRDVQMEDMITVELTQKAMESGVIKEFQLSDEEIMVRHSYKVIEDYVNG